MSILRYRDREEPGERLWPVAPGQHDEYMPEPHECAVCGEPSAYVVLKSAERVQFSDAALCLARYRYRADRFLCRTHAREYLWQRRLERERRRRARQRGERDCVQCGERFTPKRSDSRYCSDACRVKAYRQRKKAQA